jgi:hypothetical protein
MMWFVRQIGTVNDEGGVYLPKHAAKWSYTMADAMLEARKQ